MSGALGLHRLQMVDRQLDRLRAEVETIRRELGENSAERRALSGLTTTNQLHDAAGQRLKAAGEETRQHQAKVQQVEADLYGGRLGNPRELEELQTELGGLKRQLGLLEERELTALEEAEVLQGPHDRIRSHS